MLLAAAHRTNAWGNHTCKKPIKRRGKQTTHNDERWRAAACARERRPHKFLVLSSARSGSSYVVEMLDSHPEVCCGYELLIPQWKDPCAAVGHKNIRTCHSAVGKAITGAIDAIHDNSRKWSPPRPDDAISRKALAHLEKAWWPRFDQYRFCRHTRCCSRGFKWFPRSQGLRTAAGVEHAARWASQSDVRFVVLKRRDTLALIASRWRKDKMHEASKAFGTSNGVALAGHSGKKARGALPTASLDYVRDQCRQLQEVDKLNERLLRAVPAARKFPVAFEELTGAEGESHWRRLLAFVGARDLAASLETSLVRLGNATARRFANEEAVAAALRGAGC